MVNSRQLMAAIAALASLSLSGCDDGPATIWSTASKSPSSRLLATAETVQTAGFGTAGVSTVVYIKHPSGSAFRVLAFSNDSAYPLGHTVIRLNWTSDSRLEVRYKAGATLTFRVAKALGVNIVPRQE